MKTKTETAPAPGRPKTLRRLYILTFIVLAFTGFGQMPIFKRYGLSSIPGLGWSANYYATHYIHYLGAIFLIALMAYTAADFFSARRKYFRLTRAGIVQIVLLSAVVATGVFRVLKNLPDVVFSPGFTMFIDLSHLSFMMLYFLAALFLLITGRKWLSPIQR